ncbi:MAG: alanine:cation symporter family protein [Lachnospiraceae bacterium]|nr:alanine:cation symporter family protein [Lachnospiraceae bacterium]
MNVLFEMINQFFAGVVPVADFLWDFPTNIDAYANIPILGQLSLAFLLLLGGSLYFTIRFGFVQIREFRKGLTILAKKQQTKVGTSQLAAFLISMGGRVGAGNIVGVTGAVTIGGPGAIFWMWVSAFLGMATAFGEATLAQIFKEKKGNEYVGGFTFYIQKIWKNKVWIGTGMCVLYLLYNMLSIPVHTYHVFTAVSSIADEITGRTTEVTEPLYYIIALAIIVIIAVITFGGIQRVARFSDRIVPVMAAAYVLIVLVLIVLNFEKIPAFFVAVIGGAFKPQAIFGGTFGVAMAQGLKRGLLSNEAGMGTATQAASIAECNHPCEQGIVQAIGVFVDTIVICTLAGFVVTAGAIWENPAFEWESLKSNKIGTFLASVKVLVPGEGTAETVVFIVIVLAFGLFAFTTLLCDLTYTEIAANKISKSRGFITFSRCLGALFFVPVGTLTVLAGLDLDNLWYVSDLINVILIFINIPTLFMARNLITQAYENYKNSHGRRFVSADIGIKTEVWTLKAQDNK